MALNPCVKVIVCALSEGVRGALNSTIDLYLAQLRAQILLLEAQILKYDVLLLPVQAANAAAQAALNQLRSVAGLIPSNLIENCVDMGDITLNFQAVIDTASGDLNDFTQDATRLLSVREELNFLVEQYNQIIDQFNDLKAVIAGCN